MIKTSNFHTHTKLCNHAIGLPVDYAIQAKNDGCSMLGFSDHCPYPNDDSYCWENIRMKTNQVSFYVEEVKKAKESVDFPVLLGFECEWDSKYESWYRDELIGKYNADYLVLGSHWLTKNDNHIYAMNLNNKKDFFTYIDQTIAGIMTGLFKFLAHPDLFMHSFIDWDDDIKSCSESLIDAAMAMNMPLEINGLGLNREMMQTKRGMRFQYPYDEFWELVAKKGATVICNSDAHEPKDVITNALLARKFAEKFSIIPIEVI